VPPRFSGDVAVAEVPGDRAVWIERGRDDHWLSANRYTDLSSG
jgi:hypothetical protein